MIQPIQNSYLHEKFALVKMTRVWTSSQWISNNKYKKQNKNKKQKKHTLYKLNLKLKYLK